MVELIKASERHFTSAKWLKSYFLFSFADYYNPDNVSFGPLRVFNDDVISPKSGFPQHPHAEMEIVTLVLDGEISHEDTLGNKTTITAGEVQRMSAGTGLAHSEQNNTDKEVHLFQLWFLPNKKNLAPSYEQKRLDFLDTKNELVPLATGQKVLEDVVFLNSNSTVYYGNLQEEKEYNFQTFNIRKSLIYLINGEMFVNGYQVFPNDQLRISDVEAIILKANKDSTFVLIDVPAVEANY